MISRSEVREYALTSDSPGITFYVCQMTLNYIIGLGWYSTHEPTPTGDAGALVPSTLCMIVDNGSIRNFWI